LISTGRDSQKSASFRALDAPGTICFMKQIAAAGTAHLKILDTLKPLL
jgi:hypothetical protein